MHILAHPKFPLPAANVLHAVGRSRAAARHNPWLFILSVFSMFLYSSACGYTGRSFPDHSRRVIGRRGRNKVGRRATRTQKNFHSHSYSVFVCYTWEKKAYQQ